METQYVNIDTYSMYVDMEIQYINIDTYSM